MIKLNINLEERSYPIYIESSFESLGKCLTGSKLGKKAVLITDSNVDRFHSEECLNILKQNGFQIFKYVIEAGEKSKHLDTIRNVYEFLVQCKLDRSSTLLALGGGVVGDITGFAAATFLRGINFVQVPTSLLAQADSSVGGKVGVDFNGSKNIIGAFYQPRLVFINVNTLKTLPIRELNAGMAEIIKHGLIRDAEFFDFMDYNISRILSFDEDSLYYMTKMNCRIKGDVVEEDEKEQDIRAILNFGHTIGHAIESVSSFDLLHGECVSLGMAGAYYMARYMGMVEEAVVARVLGMLQRAGLPVRLPNMDIDKVYLQMFQDKKIINNKLNFILPKGIGEVVQCTIEDEVLIKKVLADLG